ncbi:MAG: phosphatidate cytidylyltransferase [Woeseia sp.]
MLKQRVITAIIAIVVLGVVLFVLPASAARFVIAAVMLVAAWEWGGFLGQSTATRGLCVVVVAALQGLLYFLLSTGDLAALDVFRVALVSWVAALVWLFFYPTPVPRWLTWLAAVLVLLPAWLALDYVYRASPTLLLFMLVIVWAADIGAYFAGKQFGRVKLAPRVSPGKTWEGVFGGVALVVALSFAGAGYLGLRPATLLPFSVCVALLSIVGDLTVSAFKRSVHMKDSGTLFPGHGGLLDRIDSVMAAAPLFALGMAWAGLA